MQACSAQEKGRAFQLLLILDRTLSRPPCSHHSPARCSHPPLSKSLHVCLYLPFKMLVDIKEYIVYNKVPGAVRDTGSSFPNLIYFEFCQYFLSLLSLRSFYVPMYPGKSLALFLPRMVPVRPWLTTDAFQFVRCDLEILSVL